ncbi:unnamed protein product [Arctogadus glacialis]
MKSGEIKEQEPPGGCEEMKMLRERIEIDTVASPDSSGVTADDMARITENEPWSWHPYPGHPSADTLPMLGNVLLLRFFALLLFAQRRAKLWAWLLRNAASWRTTLFVRRTQRTQTL